MPENQDICKNTGKRAARTEGTGTAGNSRKPGRDYCSPKLTDLCRIMMIMTKNRPGERAGDGQKQHVITGY